VCSACADGAPSAVRIVQPSPPARISADPSPRIGSIVMTVPSRSGASRPGTKTFGTVGSSWIERPMPWPVSAPRTAKPRRSASSWTARPIAFVGGGQARDRRRHPADGDADRRVGVVAVELGGDVELHELAAAQPPRAGDPVHRLVVDADADRAGEAVHERRRRPRAVAGEHTRGERVELGGGHAGADAPGDLAQRRGHGAAGAAQALEVLGRVDRHGRDPNTG
jgi:hypothetical protein